MTILVVNESLQQRHLLETTLREGGFPEVRQAASATDAFRYLGLDEPADVVVPPVQLILMDILMAPIDGVEACAHITRSERAQGIPVVMVCALNDERRLQRAFDMGAVDYVMRPIRDAELLARIRHIIRLNRETALRNARERELLVVTRQLASANEALQRLSLQDALTGIANRRHLDEYLDREWRRAIRSKAPLSVVMADIDNFKSYNDTYGHGAGDEALKRVAQAMGGSLRRAGDLVTRCGGEEFAVVLPETSLAHAHTVAETLRTVVESLHIRHIGSPVADWVTISVGVASEVPERTGSAAALLGTADKAMYRSKHAGRNRVTAAA
ncbi:MAG TPA: diguanylate cyclase [Gemmatimonadales bacterium]|nr:diguanylate cyclase [Gemmatimonadales bacterium]